MPADAVLRNLLFLYAGVVIINVLMSAVLWIRDRNPLFRSLLVAWTWMVVAFITGGALSAGTLAIITGFLPGFAVNLMFARILGATTGIAVPLRPYLVILGVAYAATIALFFAGRELHCCHAADGARDRAPLAGHRSAFAANGQAPHHVGDRSDRRVCAVLVAQHRLRVSAR
jgi:hypothetical protein